MKRGDRCQFLEETTDRPHCLTSNPIDFAGLLGIFVIKSNKNVLPEELQLAVDNVLHLVLVLPHQHPQQSQCN
jgi:hypothetical protein